MGVLCDTQIRELIGIEPFEENLKRPGQISFGVSSYGYDLRVGSVFKIFTNVNSTIIDPKKFSDRSFVTIDTEIEGTDHVLIPPNSFALCETVEYVSIPRDILAICVGKSTYARCGIIVNVTPIEPEWRGRITLEISNTTPLPAKIYANEGIAQLILDRKSTRLNSSHSQISYAVFCLKQKTHNAQSIYQQSRAIHIKWRELGIGYIHCNVSDVTGNTKQESWWIYIHTTYSN